jgi:AcrR family transcriptional regulator
MARTVKVDEYKAKREQILDAALALIHSRGYEQMTIQGLLDELTISRGAFYHYFDTKQSVLDALVDRMSAQGLDVMLPIVEDPDLSALDKLRRYIQASVAVKTTNRGAVEAIAEGWYSDGNALLRQKLISGMTDITGPLIIEPILRQGVREGNFSVRHPEQTARIIMGLALSLGDDIAQLPNSGADGDSRLEAMFEAWFEAVEGILRAPQGSLTALAAPAVDAWRRTDN